ncbi:RING finger domain-containing protein [Candidatus Sororendozoicomonas aggregata]|uniref:RING finger domain-containing protein n=1 Tax=Candidatus Sororendozoicomonas aggregata TaxID=3073239 RepID=UPI002ED473BD
MPNDYGTFPEQPVTNQPSQRGYAPVLNQSNTDYPQMPLAELTDELCTICQENFVAGNKVGKLKKCNHIFHENCILSLLGVPSIYLDPSEPPQMYPFCCRKAVRACGPNINMCLLHSLGGTCCICCIPFCSCNLHPRHIELSDNDITLLHKPEDPGFLRDHLSNLKWFYNDCFDGEWFHHYEEKLPKCPNCRNSFEVRESYTLYQMTN